MLGRRQRDEAGRTDRMGVGGGNARGQNNFEFNSDNFDKSNDENFPRFDYLNNDLNKKLQ
jgi:hypothetical protein